MTEDVHRGGRRTPPPPLLPGPGNPALAAAALSAAEARRGAHGPRPVTPRPAHQAGHSSRLDSIEDSDYSSYQSPSRHTPGRTPAKSEGGGGGVAKGLLAGLGVGWFAKKMKDRKDKRDEDRWRREEEDRRAGARDPRYTGDGYSSPPRRDAPTPGHAATAIGQTDHHHVAV